jgi:hypothetical protein
MKISRRKFVSTSWKSLVMVALFVKAGPLAFAEETGKLPAAELTLNGQALRVNSGRSHAFPNPVHHHTFDILLDILRNPPEEGFEGSSTVSMYPFKHHHKVELSKKKLEKIFNGETVTVNDRNFDHRWAIRLA